MKQFIILFALSGAVFNQGPEFKSLKDKHFIVGDQIQLRHNEGEGIRDIVPFMTAHDSLVIEVGVYTLDPTTDRKLSLKMTQISARTYYNDLVKNGAPEERLRAKGYGPKEGPLSDEDLEKMEKHKTSQAGEIATQVRLTIVDIIR